MMRITRFLAIGISCLLWSSSASAEVALTIQGGRVTLIAKDATLRQILAEWARVGQTRIVNAERVPGGPVTLQLTNVPEEQALETLLRPLSGYVAAPRASDAANLSRFERILVMPTVAPPPPAATATTGSPSPQTPTVVTPGPPMQQPAAAGNGGNAAADDQEQDRPAATSRNPAFNTVPQPPVANPPHTAAPPPAQTTAPAPAPGVVPPPPASGAPPQQNAPATHTAPTYPGTPTVPYGGVSVPGMVAPPPPQQPGQTPNAAPPRRPGGGES